MPEEQRRQGLRRKTRGGNGKEKSMRIIAGDYKGRKLITPNGRNLVRPTSEKVKGAIFSMIQDRIEGSVFCDLFAGTGSLGLEALSRGADFCWFGDHAQECVTMVRKNIELCRAEEYAHVTHGDFLKTLQNIDGKVDVFLLDPPYKKGALEASIEAIADMDLLADNGVIIAEHGSDKELPEELFGFRKVKEKRYGIVVISVYM